MSRKKLKRRNKRDHDAAPAGPQEAEEGATPVAVADTPDKMGRAPLVILILLVVIAAILRLGWLGLSAFRADTIEFYRYAMANHDPMTIWRNPPWWNQSPLAEVSMLWFLRFAHLSPTPFNVRLLFALTGIATIPAMFLLCRRVLGVRAALVAAALSCVNPYQLYFSREAYHYVHLLFFCTIQLWAFWKMWDALREERVPSIWMFIVFFLSSLGACHSHMAAWPAFAIEGTVMAGTAFMNFRKKGPPLVRILTGLSVTGVVVLVTLAPWIRRAMKHLQDNPTHFKKFLIPGQENPFIASLKRFMPMFTFGYSPWGITLLCVLVLLGVAALIATGWKKRAVRRMTWISIMFLVLSMVIIRVIGKGYGGEKYFSPVWPLTMMGLAAFICAIGEWLASKIKKNIAEPLVVTLTCGLIAFWALPAWAIVQLDGKPIPYHKIVATIERELPPGTIVLVDRWFEAIVEMRVYAPSNRYITFTIPNEPHEAYIQNRWRDTAKAFFEKYPTAAYLEVSKSYFTVPEIGWWHWPRNYFKHHIVIKNEPGLLLRKWGMVPRGHFFEKNMAGLICELFYDKPEEAVKKNRESGKSSMVLFGPEWSFVKTRDFRDWRVMGPFATLEVYNLDDKPEDVRLRIDAVANGHIKQVKLGEGTHSFPANQVASWETPVVTLAPGCNVLQLTDPLWGSRQVPLLVGKIQVLTREEKKVLQEPVSNPAP